MEKVSVTWMMVFCALVGLGLAVFFGMPNKPEKENNSGCGLVYAQRSPPVGAKSQPSLITSTSQSAGPGCSELTWDLMEKGGHVRQGNYVGIGCPVSVQESVYSLTVTFDFPAKTTLSKKCENPAECLREANLVCYSIEDEPGQWEGTELVMKCEKFTSIAGMVFTGKGY